MANDDDEPQGDCNKCGMVGDVNPQTSVCESCGCTDPQADYTDEVWLVGRNPFAN